MSFLTDSVLKISELVALNIIEVDRPVLSFDVHKKQLIYAFVSRAAENKEYIIELRINVTELYRLEKVIVYSSQDKAIKPIFIAPPVITMYAEEEFAIPVTSESQDTCEPFTCSPAHLEMLDKLKVAQEKGCF